MKKILSVFLVVLMVMSIFALAGCGGDDGSVVDKAAEQLKLGLGIHSYIEKVENAKADKNGGGEATTTVAAVLLNKDGKIVDCVIDTAANAINFTADGKAIAVENPKTKYEMGKDYGMVAYAGAKKEWYEQVDAFVALVKGKTLEEVTALKGEDNKGVEEVINAGCTIEISDFIIALTKAVSNAADSKATDGATLNIGIAMTQNAKDATADADGSNSFELTITAAAVDKDNKVVAATVDAVAPEIKFDSKGESKSAYGTAITTKRTAGDSYGMVAYGNAKKEWFEQADVFAKEIIGKNAADIAKLVVADGKGNDALQTAGCTIAVSDMVKSAEKAAK